MDFVDRVHGTGFPKIRPWRPRLAIPVEIVDVVAGTDSSRHYFLFATHLQCLSN